ncbi:AGC/AKT protein kinase [Capsaspora owczarzaki ATCC 30864]|uniref:non-specific serine/threonine protein kinase n=1 Tax=Capsaspora owczarzaki (strain ATCC 30864) TaxID=595528 RepID=A0A0D2WSQ2_CAPO3|nr:AGC/AKT protein kinase [Capsaspora owczarzaki ATCC 30864]
MSQQQPPSPTASAPPLSTAAAAAPLSSPSASPSGAVAVTGPAATGAPTGAAAAGAAGLGLESLSTLSLPSLGSTSSVSSSSSSSAAAALGAGASGTVLLKEGWLDKQGALFKKWVSRYFVLRNYILNYYRDPSKGGDPSSTIDLRRCKVQTVGTENEFVIILRNDHRVNLQAKTAEIRDSWMAAITEAAEKIVANQAELGSNTQAKPLDAEVIERMIGQEEKRLAELTEKYESFYDPPATLENQLIVQQQRIKELKNTLVVIREKPPPPPDVRNPIPDLEFCSDPTVTARLGPQDFSFWKVLGKGTFGKVILASKNDTKQVYAVKIIKKAAVVESEQTISHTVTENRVLKILEHPFVVKLFFAFQTDDRLFFVMEYINGGEIYTHLKRAGPFSEDKTRFYLAEIGSALTYLHAKGIVYRDLKLENLLLDHDGHIRITDFGLSKDNLQPEDRTATFCGTPEYIAPEVLEDDDYGRSVDWWALGIVCYEMQCGHTPFRAKTIEGLFEMILYEPINYPPHFSPLTLSLLHALLVRDPRDRLGRGPSDGQEILRHRFFASIDFDKLLARQLTPPYVPPVTSELDVSNFDVKFTKMPAVLTPNQRVVGHDDDIFKGFTYQGKSDLTTDA